MPRRLLSEPFRTFHRSWRRRDLEYYRKCNDSRTLHRTSCRTAHLQDCRDGISCTAWLSRQFVKQCLRVLQVGGVEALGEPVVDFGKHLARLVAGWPVSRSRCIAPPTPSRSASGPSAQPRGSRSATIPISPEATGSTAPAIRSA